LFILLRKSLTSSTLLFYLFTTSLYAQDFSIRNGWQLLGAKQKLNLKDFDDSCVKYIWKYDTNTTEALWKLYLPNGTSSSYPNLTETVDDGEGFWVKSDGNCSVSAYNDREVFFSKTTGMPYSGGIDDRIIADISHAQSSIYLAIYEITNDRIRDALIDAHTRGVDVSIVTDDGSKDDDDIITLESAGITVLNDEKKSALMHNKFMIIDDRILWSGSTNYSYYAFYRNYENAVRISSHAIADFYTDEFFELQNHHAIAGILQNSLADIYFSPEDHFKNRLLTLIHQAKQSIYFMIFAFTDKDLADALIDAQKRGVRVKGVFDERFNKNRYSKFDYLKDAGIDVKLDGNPQTLHDKVMIFDDNVTVTGSYNFTLSANSKNAENSLVFTDKTINQQYKNEFYKIYTEAK